MNDQAETHDARTQPPKLSPKELVLVAIGADEEPASPADLASELQMDPAVVAGLLLELELDGAVERLPGNVYCVPEVKEYIGTPAQLAENARKPKAIVPGLYVVNAAFVPVTVADDDHPTFLTVTEATNAAEEELESADYPWPFLLVFDAVNRVVRAVVHDRGYTACDLRGMDTGGAVIPYFQPECRKAECGAPVCHCELCANHDRCSHHENPNDEYELLPGCPRKRTCGDAQTPTVGPCGGCEHLVEMVLEEGVQGPAFECGLVCPIGKMVCRVEIAHRDCHACAEARMAEHAAGWDATP